MGAAGVWIEDCLTDMVGPEAFESLNVRFLRPLVQEIRAAGMHSIHYFCGNPKGKWDQLLAVGADAIALEESKKGFEIDIEDVVDVVQGRMAVLGNLDAIGILQDGSEQELAAEIDRQVRAGRRNKGRFVMSIGSPVTPATPVERVRRYCDLVHHIGSGETGKTRL
jgi:uroporphyrinogen-III decarboxylase